MPRYIDADVNEVLLGDVIPIAVMKRAISGINAAEGCDQATRRDYELRRAISTVLEWYETPSYKWDLEATKKMLRNTARNTVANKPKTNADKHGMWIRVFPHEKAYKRRCSVCGETANMIRCEYPYCPFCCAKMDLN